MDTKRITPLYVLQHMEEIICGSSIAAMLVICSCNVFCRYILRQPISWADEIDICLLAWTTFLGSAVAYKRNLHYGMDFIINHVPKTVKRVMRAIITALICATCILITYESFIFTLNAQKVMPYTRFSYKWIDASAVVGFASMSVHSMYYLFLAIFHPSQFDARYIEAEEEEQRDDEEARKAKEAQK